MGAGVGEQPDRVRGVAISNTYPEAKSVGRWLRHGWHVALAYVLGFFVLLALVGWHPTDKRGKSLAEASPALFCRSVA